MRVDIVQERFLAIGAQNKYVVLVNLTVKVFLVIGRNLSQKLCKLEFVVFLFRFGNHSIE